MPNYDMTRANQNKVKTGLYFAVLFVSLPLSQITPTNKKTKRCSVLMVPGKDAKRNHFQDSGQPRI
jgi:hypothetical protein